MKKTLSIILCLSLLISCVPLVTIEANADTIYYDGSWAYEIVDDYAVLKRPSKSIKGQVGGPPPVLGGFPLKVIDTGAFPEMQASMFVIPQGVETISGYSFNSAGFTSIVLPKSIQSIGFNAFVNCFSFTTVYYEGSASDWEKVSNSDWYWLGGATIHYDFDYSAITHTPASIEQYMADVILCHNYYGCLRDFSGGTPQNYSYNFLLDQKIVSKSEITVDALNANSDFIEGVSNWEMVTFKPTDVYQNGIDEASYYEAIVFNILNSQVKDSIVSSAAIEAQKNAVGITNEIFGVLKTDLEMDYKTLLKQPWSVFDAEKQSAALTIASKNCSIMKKTSSFAGGLSTLISSVDTVQDVIDKIASFDQIAKLDCSVKAVLDDMYEACPEENAAMRTAIDDVRTVCSGSFEKSWVELKTEVAGGVKLAADVMIDSVWNAGIAAASNGALAGVIIGQTVGRPLSNFLFSTDATIEQFYAMRALTEFEETLIEATKNLADQYIYSGTREDAVAFLNSVKMLIAAYRLSCDYADDYKKIIETEGLVNSIQTVFGFGNAQSYTDFSNDCKSMKAFLDVREDELMNLEYYLHALKIDNEELYNSYMNSQSESINSFYQTKVITVASTADVEIYQEEEKVVSVIANELVGVTPEVAVFIEEDVKHVIVPAEGNYSVRITGTADGSMNYSVNEYKDGVPSRKVLHKEIPLTKGCSYDSNVKEADNQEVLLINENGEKMIPYYDTDRDMEAQVGGNDLLTAATAVEGETCLTERSTEQTGKNSVTSQKIYNIERNWSYADFYLNKLVETKNASVVFDVRCEGITDAQIQLACLGHNAFTWFGSPVYSLDGNEWETVAIDISSYDNDVANRIGFGVNYGSLEENHAVYIDNVRIIPNEDKETDWIHVSQDIGEYYCNLSTTIEHSNIKADNSTLSLLAQAPTSETGKFTFNLDDIKPDFSQGVLGAWFYFGDQYPYAYITLTSENWRGSIPAAFQFESEENGWYYGTVDTSLITFYEDANLENIIRLQINIPAGYTVCIDGLMHSSYQYGFVNNWNLNLGDDICATFDMFINPNVAENSNSYVEVAVDSCVTRFPIAKNEESVQATVAAAQMTEEIKICVVDGGGNRGETYTYSVRQYADYVLGSTEAEYVAAQELVRAMLNYGGKAQTYFDCNAATMADDGIAVAECQMPTAAETEMVVSGSVEDVSFYAASLLYRSKIALRYYFNVTGDISDFIFSAGDAVLSPVYKDGRYYVEIADIAPQDLNASFAVTVQNVAGETLIISYSPMHYIVRKYHGEASDSLKALLQALYTYYEAVNAYITAKETVT